MSNKNILYIGGFELPDKNAAAHRVVANGKILRDLGYNVYYIGVDKSINYFQESVISLEIDGYFFLTKPQKYPRSKFEWFNFLTNISFFENIIEKELNFNVDIIIVYNYPSITLKKLINYARKHKIKLIADITEWYVPQGNLLYKFLKSIDTSFRMRILHKKLDGLITISNFLSNYYRNHPNIIEIPPLIDKFAIKWNISKHEISNKNIINLVFVGTPGNGQKDRLDYVIKLLSRVKSKVRHFELIIVGITFQQYQDIFGNDSIPSNVLNQISFLGKKPHILAIEYIKKSDFSIFFRNRNLVNTAGFPTKFVESISCGTPVITNSSSNIIKYIENEKIGFILEDKNEETLVKSLISVLCKNEDEIKKMKDNCLNSKSFYFKNYSEKFKSLINKL